MISSNEDILFFNPYVLVILQKNNNYYYNKIISSIDLSLGYLNLILAKLFLKILYFLKINY